MPIISTILGLALIILTIRVVWASRSPDDRPLGSAWFCLLVPVLAAALYLTLLVVVVRAPQDDWNATRLATNLGLSYGYKLYYGAGEGPITVMMYGPIAALVFRPSALAATPTGAVLIAAVINTVLVFFPVLLLNLQAGHQGPNGRIRAIAGFCMASGAILATKGTVEMATLVHADAPALGLGLLSCSVLIANDGEPGWGRVALSAGLAVAAVWAKQVEAPLIIAIGTYLALAYGLRSLFRFVLCALVVGVLCSVALIGWFGWDDLVYNMFVVPAKHPWFGPAAWALTMASIEMAPPFLLFGSVVAAGIFVTLSNRFHKYGYESQGPSPGLPVNGEGGLPPVDGGIRRGACRDDRSGRSKTGVPNPRPHLRSPVLGLSKANQESLREWFRSRNWTLIVLVALFMVPTSLLGRVKWGGWLNAYHTLYYLICAASLVLIDVSRPEVGKKYHRCFSWALAVGAVVFIALNLPSLEHLPMVARPELNPQEQAYEFTQKHPGKAYFPWNTLSTLMAEGKLYHQEPGIDHREAAGPKITEKLFLEHVPADMKYLAYHRNSSTRSLGNRFPEFVHRERLRELPGWIVYERDKR